MSWRAEENPRRGQAERPTTFNLLFVCTGNTCRSPLAAAIAEDMIARRGWHNVRVRSAGASAGSGAPASPLAIKVAEEHGLDLTAHTSQPLTRELVEWADAIIAMGVHHAALVTELGGGGKVSLASQFIDDADADSDIPDPIGTDVAVYRATYAVLFDVVKGVLDRLEAILAP
jgi:protein-tyrosine-phosphatase